MSPFGKGVVSPGEPTGHENKLPVKNRPLAGPPLWAGVEELAEHKSPVTVTVWLPAAHPAHPPAHCLLGQGPFELL